MLIQVNRLFWCFETKAWKRDLVKKYEKAMELGLPSNASTGKMIDAICKALGEADITQLQAWEKEVHSNHKKTKAADGSASKDGSNADQPSA
jgi:hypothetical protein